MGLLSRLREWIAGSGAESDAAESDEAAAEGRLDPENVTEVRTGSETEAVEKLQEVRSEQDDDETD